MIGAGLGGLTAAAALAQRGWTVRVHERDEEIRAFGAGIYVWGNGLRVLRALGAYDQAVEGAHVGPALESRDHRDRTVERIAINGPGQPRVYTILRERLMDALLDAARRAGADIVTGSTAHAASRDGEVTFADGTRTRADLVVAADGVNSRIRDGLGLLRRRVRMSQGAARLLIPRSPDFVAPRDAGKYLEYFSGSRRILYTPSSADELYVALVCDTGDHAGRRVPVDTASWTRSFPRLRNLVEHLDGAARWDAFEVTELSSWSAGRVAVIGDAAHAQPPYLGQGGGSAMMNALGLADAITGRTGTLAYRLMAWEATERPVIEHTQRFSQRLGMLNRVPDAPRSVLLSLLGRSATLGRMRLRAAQATPTGYERFGAGEHAS